MEHNPPYSTKYWRHRYEVQKGNSGRGSYGKLAEYKARFINLFCRRYGIDSMVELGCGDGNQMSMFDVPRYVGLDVSEDAISRCANQELGPAKREFFAVNPVSSRDDHEQWRSHVSISLDVIYHLVEDNTYERYLDRLDWLSKEFIIIYSSDFSGRDEFNNQFVLHRQFTKDVQNRFPHWQLIAWEINPYKSENNSPSDFFVFRKTTAADHQSS